MNDIEKWRNSRLHRRCSFCKHIEHRGGLDHSHYICKAKLIIRQDIEVDWHRPFCRLFSLKSVGGKEAET